MGPETVEQPECGFLPNVHFVSMCRSLQALVALRMRERPLTGSLGSGSGWNWKQSAPNCEHGKAYLVQTEHHVVLVDHGAKLCVQQ